MFKCRYSLRYTLQHSWLSDSATSYIVQDVWEGCLQWSVELAIPKHKQLECESYRLRFLKLLVCTVSLVWDLKLSHWSNKWKSFEAVSHGLDELQASVYEIPHQQHWHWWWGQEVTRGLVCSTLMWLFGQERFVVVQMAYVRFEVLMVAWLRIWFLWDVGLCHCVSGNITLCYLGLWGIMCHQIWFVLLLLLICLKQHVTTSSGHHQVTNIMMVPCTVALCSVHNEIPVLHVIKYIWLSHCSLWWWLQLWY